MLQQFQREFLYFYLSNWSARMGLRDIGQRYVWILHLFKPNLCGVEQNSFRVAVCGSVWGESQSIFSGSDSKPQRWHMSRRPAATVFPGIISASHDPDLLQQRLKIKKRKQTEKMPGWAAWNSLKKQIKLDQNCSIFIFPQNFSFLINQSSFSYGNPALMYL